MSDSRNRDAVTATATVTNTNHGAVLRQINGIVWANCRRNANVAYGGVTGV
ncbi:hypothetical protein [Nonomuraea sp. JJY05]|uniref:hypothetical protein n=1 Tax=Nonomuraea sp. JJY05 TaxID=3350255 RepID=UPI00373E16EE